MASKTSKLVPIDKGPVDVTPLGILQIAVQQGADVDKLAKLMELQERWQANHARQAYNAAMAKFKQRPPKITKNKHVKFDDTEYDHATLDHVVDAITESLARSGSAISGRCLSLRKLPLLACSPIKWDTPKRRHSRQALTLRGTRTPSRPSAQR